MLKNFLTNPKNNLNKKTTQNTAAQLPYARKTLDTTTKKTVRHKEPDLLNLSSQNRPFNNNQHEKVEIPSTTTKQTPNHKPN